MIRNITNFLLKYPIAANAADQFTFVVQSFVLNYFAFISTEGDIQFKLVTIVLLLSLLSPVVNAFLTWRLIDDHLKSDNSIFLTQLKSLSAFVIVAVMVSAYILGLSAMQTMLFVMAGLLNGAMLLARDLMMASLRVRMLLWMALVTFLATALAVLLYQFAINSIAAFLLIFVVIPRSLWVLLGLPGILRMLRDSYQIEPGSYRITRQGMFRAVAVAAVAVRIHGAYFIFVLLGMSEAAIVFRKLFVGLSPASQLMQVSYAYVIPRNISRRSVYYLFSGVFIFGTFSSMIILTVIFDIETIAGYWWMIVMVIGLMCTRGYLFTVVRRAGLYHREFVATVLTIALHLMVMPYLTEKLPLVLLVIIYIDLAYIAVNLVPAIVKNRRN